MQAVKFRIYSARMLFFKAARESRGSTLDLLELIG